MSEAQGQGKLSQLWSRYRPSQALLVSAAVGVVLLGLFLANWSAYRTQPHRVAWSDYMQWPQCLALTALWLVICVLTYWLVQLWHEELPTDNSSIESAWRAGIKTLQSHGKSLDQSPLYFVLGAGDLAHQRQLLAQSGLQLIDELVPNDPETPLRWAITEQGIWLFIDGAGTYTSLQKRLAIRSNGQPWFSETSSLAPTASMGSMGSMVESSFDEPAIEHSDHVRGAVDWSSLSSSLSASTESSGHAALTTASSVTSSPDQFASTKDKVAIVNHLALGSRDETVSGHDAPPAVDVLDRPLETTTRTTAQTAATSSQSVADATLANLNQLEDLLQSSSQVESVAARPKTGPNPQDSAQSHAAWQTEMAFQAGGQPSLLSSVELVRQQHALLEICRRVRSQRRSLAPVNGVIACVQSNQLISGAWQASELGLALRSDLQLVQESLQLHAPTTIMIDGVEQLAGAQELIRRGGPVAASSEGVGAAFPMRYQPEKQLVAHLCKLAVAQVESRIYGHLQSADSLKQVGNHRLFELLIACRSRLMPGLQTFAGEALSMQLPGQSAAEPLLLAGVQLVASGAGVTEQAWAGKAFAQAIHSQNYLIWTSERLRRDRQLNFTISALKAACLVLIVTLIASAWFLH